MTTNKKTMLVRVNKEAWFKSRQALPDFSDNEISKILCNTSLIQFDKYLNLKPPKRNKKGSLIDILFWVGVLFVLTFIGIISLVMLTNINNTFQASSIIPASAKAASAEALSQFPGALDNSFLILTIFAVISTFILASLVRVHPIFIVFYLIALVVVVFFSALVSNMYQEMAAQPALISAANQFAIMSYIMEYLPLFVGVIGSILAMVMFKLWSNAQNE